MNRQSEDLIDLIYDLDLHTCILGGEQEIEVKDLAHQIQLLKPGLDNHIFKLDAPEIEGVFGQIKSILQEMYHIFVP